jgi:hypothetical protein
VQQLAIMWSLGALLRRLAIVGIVAFVATGRVSALSPRVTTPDSFEYVFKDESLKLIKVDDVPVRQLEDITTGVYSLKLAGTRAGCGVNSGVDGTFRCFDGLSSSPCCIGCLYR